MQLPVSAALFCLSVLSVAAPACADEKWPSRPVTIVVPGAAGGSVDTPIRLLGQKLSSLIGQPVIVVNKPGSGGIIGTQAALRAPADGYTLLAGNVGPQAINYSAYQSLPYKADELKPLAGVISFSNVLVVQANASVKTVAELVAEAKRNPQKAAFGSAGIGQTSHLMGELLNLRTGTAAVHVPYKGSAPATLALLAGETSFQFDNLTLALPHIQSNKLRALAVTSDARVPELPDVPTMAEAGYPGMLSSAWVGIFVASSTPPGLASQIEKAVASAMQDAPLRDKFRQMGGIPSALSGQAFAQFVQKDQEKWKEAIDSSGVKLD